MAGWSCTGTEQSNSEGLRTGEEQARLHSSRSDRACASAPLQSHVACCLHPGPAATTPIATVILFLQQKGDSNTCKVLNMSNSPCCAAGCAALLAGNANWSKAQVGQGGSSAAQTPLGPLRAAVAATLHDAGPLLLLLQCHWIRTAALQSGPMLRAEEGCEGAVLCNDDESLKSISRQGSTASSHRMRQRCATCDPGGSLFSC